MTYVEYYIGKGYVVPLAWLRVLGLLFSAMEIPIVEVNGGTPELITVKWFRVVLWLIM